MKVLRIISFLTFVFFTSCYYDVEEELYPQGSCNVSNVTYQNDIAPLVQSNCLSCHALGSSTSSINLEGYAKLKLQIDNGRFLGSVQHKSGFIAMPEGSSKLPSCSISKIEAWISAGAPNN